MTILLAEWVAPFGYPRINACSRLPMAFRSVPRPSSPPGAKASTECPSCAPTQPEPRSPGRSRHAQEPSTPRHGATLLSGHHRHAMQTPPCRTAACAYTTHSRPPPSQRQTATHAPERRHRKSRGRHPPLRTGTCRSVARPRQRPETHQNLIHPDKDHSAAHRAAPTPRHPAGHPRWRCSRPDAEFRTSLRRHGSVASGQGSSPGIKAQGSEQQPRGHRSPITDPRSLTRDMETTGFEPVTPCLQSRCSPS